MSKLSKLFADPQRFFHDAALNAQARLQLASLTSSREAEFRERVQRLGGAARFSDALQETLRGTAQLFITPSETGWDELNCFSHEVAWVLYFALLVAEKRGGRLMVTARRRTSDVARRDVSSVAGKLRAVSDFELVLALRDGVEEVVRVWVWERRDAEGIFYARGNNAFAKRLPFEDFHRLHDPLTGRVDLHQLHRKAIDSECTFDVDFVYTWVNHADPTWRALISQHRDMSEVDWDRYHAADELKYSLRSVHQHAPWARNIYVVTNCARPPWLAEHPKIRWVMHEEVFPDTDYLPTFNSHAIEACLMRIEGLAEHFVYMNDDVFLGTPASKADFFSPNGASVSYLEPYGMVFGERSDEHPDYLNAALNGKKLIEDTFDVSPTMLHGHVPHALKRSVLFEMEERFSDAFHRTRGARFRTPDDVSIVSFFYHHYAFQTRHAVRAPSSNSVLIRPSNSADAFVDLLSGRRRRFFCINDGGDSSSDTSFAARSSEFLERYYRDGAPWEL